MSSDTSTTGEHRRELLASTASPPAVSAPSDHPTTAVAVIDKATAVAERPDAPSNEEDPRARRRRRSLLPSGDDDDPDGGGLLTVREFLVRNRLSPSFFFRMRAAGEGPRVLMIGRRTLITLAAEREWRSRYED
jgi:hypothetical protein